MIKFLVAVGLLLVGVGAGYSTSGNIQPIGTYQTGYGYLIDTRTGQCWRISPHGGKPIFNSEGPRYMPPGSVE